MSRLWNPTGGCTTVAGLAAGQPGDGGGGEGADGEEQQRGKGLHHGEDCGQAPRGDESVLQETAGPGHASEHPVQLLRHLHVHNLHGDHLRAVWLQPGQAARLPCSV